MNLIWSHDHYFIFDISTKRYYSEIEFGYNVWERYLNSFERITIISRVIERSLTSEERNKYNLSSGPKINFIHLPNINNLKGKIVNHFNVKSEINIAVNNADAVISRLPSQIGMMVLKTAKRLKVPSAVELVGCPDEALSNLKSLKAKLYKPYMVRETKKYVEESPFTLYVTKRYLQSKYPTFGKSVSCSNVTLKNTAISKPVIKKESGQLKTIIGLIGYLSEYKGIDTAYKICLELEKASIDYRLEILGGGDKEKWYDLADSLGIEKERIKIHTLPSGDAVIEWIKNIDIYIQPSRTEGLPRGLIEAMSVGKASVGSNVGGIPELLSADNVFDKEDFISMSKRVIEIIRDSKLRSSLALENQETAKEYSFGKLEEKRKIFWHDFYNYSLLIKEKRELCE